MDPKHFPAKWSSDDLLTAVEALPRAEAEKFYRQLISMRSRRRSADLSAKEAALLTKINRGFSNSWWDNYHQLVAKRQQEALTNEEQRTLLRLTDQLEKREAQRLQVLADLAALRRQSLRKVMKDLGLPEKSHG